MSSNSGVINMADVTQDGICPSCGIVVPGRCRLCGARMTINSVSRQVIWMRNGRIVKGGMFKDVVHAWREMANQWEIPRGQWPKEIQDALS